MKRNCLAACQRLTVGLTPQRLALDVLICFQIISAVAIMVSKGNMSSGLFWSGNSAAVFPDVMETAFQSYNLRPYETGAIYPPLVYVLFHVFTWFLPEGFFEGMDLTNWGLMWNKATMTQQGHGISIVFMALSGFLLYLAIRCFLKKNGGSNSKPIMWITFTCAPMLFLIERGNILLLVMAALMYFCANYRSERLRDRLLAYLCLSMVVSFKIYPVLLGCLLLADPQVKNRVWAAACCIVIGILTFVLPFFLTGGMDSFRMMLENIESYTGTSANLFGLGDKVNTGNTVKILMTLIRKEPVFEDTPEVLSAQTVVTVCAVVIGVVNAFLSDRRWKKVAGLVLVSVLLPTFSVRYNMVYMIVPLAFFFCDRQERGVLPYVYSVLFALCLAPMTFGAFSIYNTNNFMCALNLSTIVPSFVMPVMLLVLFADSVVSLILRLRKAKADEPADTEIKLVSAPLYYGVLIVSTIGFAVLCAELTRLAEACIYK